jgi:hypothetical protein
METVEKVRVLTTLKAGKQVWDKGAVLTAPLPPAILEEIRAHAPTVEVLSYANKAVMGSKPEEATAPMPASAPKLKSLPGRKIK